MEHHVLFYEVECRVYDECPHCDKLLTTTEYTTVKRFDEYNQALSYFLIEKTAECIKAVIEIKGGR